MPVQRRFQARTNLRAIPAIGDSVGAHIAAKLEVFRSDERTLTDELCDMLCLWAVQSGVAARHGAVLQQSLSVPNVPVTIELEKVSQNREALIGADLELLIRTPLGFKRMLAQAKVLDPDGPALRVQGPAGWRDLREKLLMCRAHAPGLAFLLIYVPHSELRRQITYFGTWEAGHARRGTGLPGRFGATFISVDELLRPDGRWRDPFRKLIYRGQGTWNRTSISFSRLLLELFGCLRGVWDNGPVQRSVKADQPEVVADRSVLVDVQEISSDDWAMHQDSVQSAAKEAAARENQDW